MSCDSPVITTNSSAVVVAERTDSLVLVGSNETVVIEDRQSPAVIALQDGSDIVVVPSETSQVVTTAGAQGLPGPPGAPGQAGVGYVTFLAQGAVGGHRVTRAAFAGYARYADSSTVADATAVLGISLNAADDGASVNVASSGEITEPSWAWVEDAPIFVGAMGLLTQTPPTSGFQLVVGVATSPTSMLVGIKLPIIL